MRAADNELLTRVGPGTPMGRLMRLHWIPALLSDELIAGGAPVRLRLLGENFLGFRSPDGARNGRRISQHAASVTFERCHAHTGTSSSSRR